MDKIANVLLEREVIDSEEFERLMNEDKVDMTKHEADIIPDDVKNAPDVPEMPDIRVDKLPGTGRDFIA